MLVLSRKAQQEVVIGDNVRITVLQIKGNTVRLGISAPRDILVRRAELKPKAPEEMEEVTFSLADEGDDDLDSDGVIPFQRQAIPLDGKSHPPPGEHRVNRIREMLSQLRTDPAQR
jgi:carbon storage regulator CsrA